MLKILFYSHTGQISGAENILLLALGRIDRGRFAPSAVCPADGGLAGKIKDLGIPCRTVNKLEARFTFRIDLLAGYLISFFRTAKDLRAKLLQDCPELIHANSVRAGLAASIASAGTKTPVFWHVQDELPRHPLSTLIRLFVLFSSRTRLIAASRATAESFLGEILSGKEIPLRVVHNAVEMEKFAPGPNDRQRIRKELGLDDDEFVVGIVGQITPRKGQLELVRTFAETFPEMPSSTLLIVGAPMFNSDHEYLREIEDAVSALNLEKRVRFLGLRTDVPELMRAMDVLVVNSKSEALVVAAIEAMACGTAVIATDVGGTREMIEDGQNGLLVQFGNSGQLGRAMQTLSRDADLRLRLGGAGNKVVREGLTAERFISELEDFLIESAAENAPAGSLLLGEN